MTKSNIFKAAHAAARKTRDQFLSYAKAFSSALRTVYADLKAPSCTKEIWNSAASLHVRGQNGLLSLVKAVALEMGTADFHNVADHLYGRFLKAKKNDRKGHYNFGLYLNQMFDRYCK